MKRVVFSRPFRLGPEPEVYPAGAYEVETGEEVLQGRGHTAHIRTSTMLIIPTPSGTVHRQISGSDLDKALARDAERQEQSTFSENPTVVRRLTLRSDTVHRRLEEMVTHGGEPRSRNQRGQ